MSLALRLDTAPMAFGVDPTRRERYSLRQARYDAIGTEIGRLLARHPAEAERLKFLDVGVGNGVSLRHIETQPHAHRLECHGVDLKLQPQLYKPSRWASLQQGDLLEGLSAIPSAHFDVVVCEQVLEHLPRIELPMATLCRVLKPGGTLIVGVPIFPPGLHLVRRHCVPVIDRFIPSGKVRGHIQAFSKTGFVHALLQHGDLDIQAVRGFRIVSGGLLRPLENFRWWWQLCRTAGRLIPGFCTEVQVIAVKK